MPVEMEHGLARASSCIDDEPVVLEPGDARRFGDERQHAVCFPRFELGDIAECVDVPFRQHEQVDGRFRRDVFDREQPVSSMSHGGW